MKPTPRDYTTINAIMHSLGCAGSDGLYTYRNYNFDLTATNQDYLLATISEVIFEQGRDNMRMEFRELLGIYQ